MELDISVVIPAYNEEKNVLILHKEITSVLSNLKKSYEIIFVNDGSTDRTEEMLNRIKDNKTKIIHFRKNFGQTAALDAGLKASKGNVIVTMDGDLQNDPNDIPKLLSLMDKGYDIIAGWRYKRKDSLMIRFISKGAKILRRILLNDKLHDSGCTLRAYKKECIKDLNLYGEMHRFVHVILRSKGFKIAQMKVNHRKRVFGKTKYNASRSMKGFLDMLLLRFWMDFSTRPIHLFGGVGLASGAAGFLILLYLAYIRIFESIPIGNRPLLSLGVLLMAIGVQFIIFGILSDILSKVYYKDKENYSIK
jgi:glycosyltransferase involved in cell wall biosynthesis